MPDLNTNSVLVALSGLALFAGACASKAESTASDVPPRDRASLAARTEDWPTAAEQWSLVAFESGDDCIAACLAAAEAFRRLDDDESAQGMIEFGLARDPHDAELHTALGDVMFDMGFTRAAERSYEQALSLDPNHAPVCLKLARLRLELGLESAALKVLDGLARTGHACPETWFLRGAALQARGDYEGAWKSYRESFATDADPEPLRRLAAARVFFSGPGKRVPGARASVGDWLAQVVELDPQNSEALYMIGTLDRERGEYERAIRVLRRAVEIDPASFEYVEALAEAYFETGDVEQMAAMLDRARALDPGRSTGLAHRLQELAAR